MKRVMFVDDDQNLLHGLKRMLHPHRKEWEMTFHENGESALNYLAESKGKIDIIVSDMRMPKMDGATLLSRIKSRYPHIIRLVLSGHTEAEMALRAVPVAHQFLNKPCDADSLKSVIDRACSLRELITGHSLQNQVGRIGNLPALPKIYIKLTELIADENVSISVIAKLIEQDAAITAKLLQLVSSSFFCIHRECHTIQQAISFIGVSTLKNVILSLEVFNAFTSKNIAKNFKPEKVQQHALQVGALAKLFNDNEESCDDAFLAGVLHEIGKLVMATNISEQYDLLLKQAASGNKKMYQLESAAFGFNHAEVGAYLLGIWGLPYVIVEAVANHHTPNNAASKKNDILFSLYIADQFLHALDLRKSCDEAIAELDKKYIQKTGVRSKLRHWFDIAEKFYEGVI